MSDGKSDERPLVQQNESVPEPYLAFARWLFEHQDVIEVWSMVSDLPEINVPEASVTLDGGTWFLCRMNMPLISEECGILSFLRPV